MTNETAGSKALRALLENGHKTTAVAAQIGVTPQTIRNIAHLTTSPQPRVRKALFEKFGIPEISWQEVISNPEN